MKFDELMQVVGSEAVFETGLLLAGDVDAADVRRQLSRWVASGQLLRLRRGLYALAPPYQQRQPHPFLVANRLAPGSYVTAQSALAHAGLIPEHAPAVVSASTGRPGRRETSLGRFVFRHLKPDLLWGYRRLDLGQQQAAFVATPEKALLDLVHLSPQGDALAFLSGLRLQNLDLLDLTRLLAFAQRTRRPKLRRAAQRLARLAASEAAEYVPR